MADDDKVKSEDLIQISKDRFLPREVRDTDPKHPEYSVEKEFAKAAKGFDWKFYSILFIFLLIVIGGTFVITTYVEIQHSKAQFSFNIDDLNLQEQISSTKREEKKVNQAKSQLGIVVKQRDEKIKEVTENYALKIEDITKQGLSAEESESEINKIKAQKQIEIDKIENEFRPKVEKEEENLARAEKEFDTKKAKLESDINKAESIVNNYKRLQQMQITKLKREHATAMENQKLRYNPYFTEAELRGILRSVDKRKVLKTPQIEDIDSLSRNNIISESELKAIRGKIEDYQRVIQRLRRIPFTNSVAPAMAVVQDDTYFLISEYERILGKMINNLEILQKYQRAFNQIAEFSVDSGIIIDASNSEDVIFTLKPVVKIEAGDIGMIFRKADEYIGSIVFENKFDKMIGRVSDLATGAKILPLDKIFIQKKKHIEPPKVVPKEESETIDQNPVDNVDNVDNAENAENKESAPVEPEKTDDTSKEVVP